MAHGDVAARGGDARAGARRREIRPGGVPRYFAEVATFPIVPPDITAIRPSIWCRSGVACIGTPDDCDRHFERLWKGSNGGFGGVMVLAHNWADWPATKRHYELMARYVHPHFQRTRTNCGNGATTTPRRKYASAGDQSRAAVQAAIDKHQARKA